MMNLALPNQALHADDQLAAERHAVGRLRSRPTSWRRGRERPAPFSSSGVETQNVLLNLRTFSARRNAFSLLSSRRQAPLYHLEAQREKRREIGRMSESERERTTRFSGD
jgi:hypothetical protein